MHVNDAVPVADVVERARLGVLDDLVLSPWDALEPMTAMLVDEATEFRVRNGRRLTGDHDVGDEMPVRIGTRAGELVAVYRRTGSELVPEVVFS